MLFLLKRTVPGGLGLLVVLAALGLALHLSLWDGPPIAFTPQHLAWGLLAVGGVLCSDALLHGAFLLLFGEPYRRCHLALAELFRGQSVAAMLVGAAVAGVGEELVFRGVSTDLRYLVPSTVLFGLLHHVRRDLWPFTVWAIWQGVLLATALRLSGNQLAVTMTAHFLHDFTGFLIFRVLLSREKRPGG